MEPNITNICEQVALPQFFILRFIFWNCSRVCYK